MGAAQCLKVATDLKNIPAPTVPTNTSPGPTKAEVSTPTHAGGKADTPTPAGGKVDTPTPVKAAVSPKASGDSTKPAPQNAAIPEPPKPKQSWAAQCSDDGQE